MATAGASWQLECEKVEQRCGYLLTSGMWSDCTFMVGSKTNQEVIQAHKLILAMASPVFEAMFYGGLSELNEPIEAIPDVQPEAFRALLQYIYTGDINIESFDMACDLWYGADKYMLPHLIKQCNSYICSVLGPRNACQAYEYACLFDEKSLMDKCIQIISTNTKEMLNDSSFEELELKTVIKVCSLDNLTVDSELDLFHAVERYAEAEQRRRGQVSPTKELLQSVEGGSQTSPAVELDSKTPTEATPSRPTANKDNLKEEEPSIHTAIQSIRFLSLSAQEFAEGPARSGLLTKDEVLALLMNIASTDSPVPIPTGFSECRERRQPSNEPLEPGSLDHTINALNCESPSQVQQEQCLEPGSLDHTMNALRYGNPSQVLAALQAAEKIMRTRDHIQPALDKGILDALVPALTWGHDACEYRAAHVISDLCKSGSPSQLRELAASAALEPYCRLLAGGGETSFSIMIGLNNLLQKVERNTRADLLQRLRVLDVPQLLVPLQQHSDGFYCMRARRLLGTYFSNAQR